MLQILHQIWQVSVIGACQERFHPCPNQRNFKDSKIGSSGIRVFGGGGGFVEAVWRVSSKLFLKYFCIIKKTNFLTFQKRNSLHKNLFYLTFKNWFKSSDKLLVIESHSNRALSRNFRCITSRDIKNIFMCTLHTLIRFKYGVRLMEYAGPLQKI